MLLTRLQNNFALPLDELELFSCTGSFFVASPLLIANLDRDVKRQVMGGVEVEGDEPPSPAGVVPDSEFPTEMLNASGQNSHC